MGSVMAGASLGRTRSAWASGPLLAWGSPAVAELLDPLARRAGDHHAGSRKIHDASNARKEHSRAKLELEVADPLLDALLSAESRLQERTSHADERRSERDRLRRVETATHATGRDQRETDASDASYGDRGRHAPVAEAISEAHARHV